MDSSPSFSHASRKRSALESSIEQWYDEDATRKQILSDIVEGRAGFSLRDIDWFVTNYTARKPVVYTLPDSGKIVDVNGDYKDVLKCFHKSGFDSFKRKGSDPSEAALRQKNFFRWAIENGVVDYVIKHVAEIEQDMSRMRKKSRTYDRRDSSQKRPITRSMGISIRSRDAIMEIPSFARPEW